MTNKQLIEQVLRTAESDAIGFHREIEDEHRVAPKIADNQPELAATLVKGLLECQIIKLKRLISQLEGK